MSEAIKPVWSAGFKTVTVQETEKHVAADIRVFCGNPDFTKRISRLIAEAGTVHHETGLTPRQLVEQRDALATALAVCESALAWAIEQGGGPACEHEASVCFCRENEAVNTARAALALVKGSAP